MFAWGLALLHASHSCLYSQARVADPQLYCAIFSQGSRNWGITIQETVLPDASGSKKDATRCHNQTLAYLSTVCSSASTSHHSKRARNQCELTPDVFFSF
jgi:hypothetical protein